MHRRCDNRTMTFVAPRILPHVIVGRDAQLATLVDTFEIVRRGRSTTVLLALRQMQLDN